MTKMLLSTFILLFSSFTFSQPINFDSYALNIKKDKIVKEKGKTYLVIRSTFINNSKENLRYFSMSCSWQDFYVVDNNKLEVERAICGKNVPVILVLAPGQTRTVNVKLLINPKLAISEIKFRIGINLIKASKMQNPFSFEEKEMKNNLIWSNVISM